MQEIKGNKPKKLYENDYVNFRINLLKKGISLRKFCDSENMNRGNIYRAFSGSWNGEKARKFRKKLLDMTK